MNNLFKLSMETTMEETCLGIIQDGKAKGKRCERTPGENKYYEPFQDIRLVLLHRPAFLHLC